jgi:hypothetical protein
MHVYLGTKKNLRNANRVHYHQLHVFGQKGASRNHTYSSFHFLGYDNLIVRFLEVNKYFWGLQAINYFVAYINY